MGQSIGAPFGGQTSAVGVFSTVQTPHPWQWSIVKVVAASLGTPLWTLSDGGLGLYDFGYGPQCSIGPVLVPPSGKVSLALVDGEPGVPVTGNIWGVSYDTQEQAVAALQMTSNPLSVLSSAPVVSPLTRVYRTALIGPANAAWNSIPLVPGTDMPHVGNQLLGFRWSVVAVQGAATATNVMTQVGLGPKGHPGGPPVLILGSDVAHLQVQNGLELFTNAINLDQFFGGSNPFAAQLLEAQLFVEGVGGGTIGTVFVAVTVLSSI